MWNYSESDIRLDFEGFFFSVGVFRLVFMGRSVEVVGGVEVEFEE